MSTPSFSAPDERRLNGGFDDQADERVIRFSAQRVLAGIRFHVIDERIADRIVTEPALAGTFGLSWPQQLEPHVDRERWRAMHNLERLRWLLDATSTDLELTAGGQAILRKRRSHSILRLLRIRES